ncbi:hypothetical protein OsJ_31508 [Oryza sativa Japonica Group]|uniref:Uncharacterized protein n=1 Tax=Oryza sativa subsp. japonica TaxID=39947 RepID=B9G5Q8_ORYSJ|nr:hypothetical protein OsJ_31508 [Oryza sativa Japonica Group]
MAAGGGGGDNDQRFDLPDDPPPAHPPARPIQGGRVDRRALAAAGLALGGAVNLAARVYFDGGVSRSVSLDEREEASPPAATPSSAPRQAAFAAAAPPEATAAAAASPGSPSTCRRTALQLLDLQVPEQWRRDDGEVDVVDLVVSHPCGAPRRGSPRPRCPLQYYYDDDEQDSDSDESEEEESFAGDDTGPGGESGSESDTAEEARLLLRCPAATTPVLALCNSSTYDNDNGGGCIAIDAPKLRSLHNLESSSPARRDESRAPPHFPRPRAPQASNGGAAARCRR